MSKDKDSELERPVVKGGGVSPELAELTRRLDALQVTLEQSNHAKNAEIEALKAKLEASEVKLAAAQGEKQSQFDQARARLQKWEREHAERLQAIEEELKAGQVQFKVSLDKEPMMTRIVGTVSGKEAEAIAKYNTYFGRIGGPAPICEPMNQGVA